MVTQFALLALIVWWLLVVGMLAGHRIALVARGERRPETFAPDGSDLTGFGQRLVRVHANNYENVPVFAAVLLFAIAAGSSQVTDGLAPWLVAARVAQGATHLLGADFQFVTVRFVFYLFQLGIIAYWLLRLLGAI